MQNNPIGNIDNVNCRVSPMGLSLLSDGGARQMTTAVPLVATMSMELSLPMVS